jgi:hypothetical protein
MPCGVELIQHHGHQGNAGVRQWYNHLDDSKYTHESVTSFGYNQASSYTGNAGESCMAVGYSWHQGGKINNSGNPRGDILTFRNGYHDLLTKWGQQTRTWNDDIDGVRLQSVPSATSSQMQFHINVPEQPQSNMNYFSPRDIVGGTVHDDNGTSFNPCPGASAKYLNSKSGVRCIYPKTGKAGADALKTLHGAKGNYKSNESDMHTSLAGTFCADSNNVFESPGGETCLARSTGAALAKTYCQVVEPDGTVRIKSDPNCTVENLFQANYDEVAKNYCNTALGRADTFCKCHNVTSGVCDANPTAAGCPKKKETFDKLVAATPSDQQDVWSGMESCFGRVCTGTGVFIPPNSNQNCDKTVNVCIQDIDIGSMTDSNITPVCDIKSGDGSPSVSEPSAAQDSAQSELDEAKAALARGDAGAQERVDAAEAALDAADESAVKPISLTDFRTNPRSYIPNSLDGLKTNRKQQIGAAAMGALVLGCMMMLLLIVASASGGGSVKKRFR